MLPAAVVIPVIPSVFCFLGLQLWHLEVARLGVELELQVLAYATATATPDPSRIWDLHRSLRQHQILNPLGEDPQEHYVRVLTH